MKKYGWWALLVTAVLVVGIVAAIRNPGTRTKPDLIALPEIKAFLREHSEFGEADYAASEPDWAQGKRQRVQFKDGRNLLFYVRDGKVVTIYQDIKDGERVKIWGLEQE